MPGQGASDGVVSPPRAHGVRASSLRAGLAWFGPAVLRAENLRSCPRRQQLYPADRASRSGWPHLSPQAAGCMTNGLARTPGSTTKWCSLRSAKATVTAACLPPRSRFLDIVDLAVLGEVADRTDGEMMARLISPSRARPWRNRAASTMSRNFSAAGDTQPSRSPSQSASCTISSSSWRCTPSHLSRSPPLGGEMRKVRTARPIAEFDSCRSADGLRRLGPQVGWAEPGQAATQTMPARHAREN